MTEKLLRTVLKNAKEKEQVGLLIWANWTVWDDLSFEMKPGDESYDFALSQVSKGEEVTISVQWNGLSIPGIIAVSVQKLSASEKFFKNVLDKCEEGQYQGPITLIPLNKVSEFC